MMNEGLELHTDPALPTEAWRSLSNDICGQCRDESGKQKDFSGSFRIGSIFGFMAVDLRSINHDRIERTSRHLRVDGFDQYKVMFQVLGGPPLLRMHQPHMHGHRIVCDCLSPTRRQQRTSLNRSFLLAAARVEVCQLFCAMRASAPSPDVFRVKCASFYIGVLFKIAQFTFCR
jgi:hypothetical protein